VSILFGHDSLLINEEDNMKTVYGLYRTNKYEIEMLAPNKASADVLRTMSGPAWKVRKLTADEVADPWVVSEIAAMVADGVWD
jgi:hypothetical protein